MLDLIVSGGTILTLNPSAPHAECLGIWNGLVVASGRHDDVEPLAVPGTRRLDLDGRVCVPGFIDAHLHFISLGLTFGFLDLKPPEVRTVTDILRLVRRKAGGLPRGEWIIGRGYDHNQLVEQRHPALEELNEIAPDHPVALLHVSGHSTVVNSRALQTAGLTDWNGDSGAGRSARPTRGLLEEGAQAAIAPFVYRRSLDATVSALAEASRFLAQVGLTTVHDAGVGRTSDEEIGAYQAARERGDLRQRVSLMVRLDVLRRDIRPWGLGVRTGFGDDVLRIGPVKIVLDGSLLGRTAAMDAPYPGTEERGELLLPEEDFRAIVADVHRRGWQCAIHAIGTRAVRLAVEAIEDAQRELPRPDPRHRIEHCGLVDPALIRRIAHAGIIPVPQPHFVSALGDGYLRVLGSEGSRYCYALRSFLEQGVAVPGSSDAPVAAPAPLLGIHSAIVRRTFSGTPFHQEESVTPEEAVRMYTRHAAYSGFDEGRLGVLRVGAHADLTILSDNPLLVDPAAIPEIRVLATYVAGKAVFEA